MTDVDTLTAILRVWPLLAAAVSFAVGLVVWVAVDRAKLVRAERDIETLRMEAAAHRAAVTLQLEEHRIASEKRAARMAEQLASISGDLREIKAVLTMIRAEEERR